MPGTRIENIRALVGEAMLEYDHGAFLKTYETRCKDTSTYYDPSMRQGLKRYLNAEIRRNWHQYTDLFASSPPRDLSPLFSGFLDNGGEGRNCHESSPTGRAIMVIDSITKTSDALSKYKAWRIFINHFASFIDQLKSTVLFERIRQASIEEKRVNIAQVVDAFEPFAQALDKQLEIVMTKLIRPLTTVIGAQIATLRALRYYALNLRPNGHISRDPEIDYFEIFAVKLLSSIREFYDPFLWVERTYSDLRRVEQIYFRESESTAGLSISVRNEHPAIDPDNPHKLRDFIDELIYLLYEKETELVFSWDNNLKAMVIESGVIGGLKDTLNGVDYEDLIALLSEVDGRIEENRVIIPIRPSADTVPPAGSYGPVVDPLLPDSATEMGAIQSAEMPACDSAPFAYAPQLTEAFKPEVLYGVLPRMNAAEVFYKAR